MKIFFGIKDKRWMSLFDENRKDEKTEVSVVPQDLTVRDAPKKFGRPSETAVCLKSYGKISRPEYQGSKSLACGVQPLDTLTTSSGPIPGGSTQPLSNNSDESKISQENV